MKKQLNKKQAEKLALLQAFLKTDIGETGIMIDDNEVTDINVLKKIYHNCTGIHFAGSRWGMAEKGDHNDTIVNDYISDITKLYQAACRGDSDFKQFIAAKNKMPATASE